jgi:hypothetical protein
VVAYLKELNIPEFDRSSFEPPGSQENKAADLLVRPADQPFSGTQ